MDIKEISIDNVEDFLPLLGEDLAEDVKRVYYNGLGVMDGEGRPAGAFVYELLNSESEEDTKGRIRLVKSDNREISESLESYYRQSSVPEDEIVESFFETDKEEEAAFLEQAGFSREKRESTMLTVTLGELMATPLGKSMKVPNYVESIEELSILQFRKAVKDIVFKGHAGAMEDIPFLPKEWFDNRISACINSGEKISGLFLVRRTPSGTLIPALLFAYGPEFQKNLGYMIRYSILQALKSCPPETVVMIPRITAAAKALTDKLLPNETGTEIFYGRRKEDN